MGKLASICGFYGHKNYGDTLMLNHIRSFIFKRLGIESNVISDKASSESVSYKDPSCLSNSDLAIIGGGGIITPQFWFFKEEIYKKLNKQKLVLFNVNFTKESIPILKNDQLDIDLIIVRDLYSFDLAKSILKDRSVEVLLAPDISTLDISRKYQYSENDYISVCLNHYVLKDFFTNDLRKRVYAEKFLLELSSFLNWSKVFNNKIQLIPSQLDKQINDNTANALIDGYINGSDHWVTNNLNIEEYLISSKLIISMRYHTTLFAIKYGIPFIDISHHSKNRNLLEDSRLSDHLVDYWSVSKDLLIQKAEKAKYSQEIKDFSSSCSVSSIEAWNNVEKALTKILS